MPQPPSIDDLPTPLLALDADGRITHANPVAIAAFGRPQPALVGATLGALLPPESAQALARSGPAVQEASLALDPMAPPAPWLVHRHQTQAGTTLILLTPIASLADERDELRRQATTDALTGLSNRRHFFTLAEQELARAARRGAPSALLLIDIDRLKAVNDLQGHPAGDRLLVSLAATLNAGARRSDLPARIGGDEFAVLLPDTGPEAARIVAFRLHESAADQGVAISIGIAHGRSTTAEILYAEADRMLYRAKQDGGIRG